MRSIVGGRSGRSADVVTRDAVLEGPPWEDGGAGAFGTAKLSCEDAAVGLALALGTLCITVLTCEGGGTIDILGLPRGLLSQSEMGLRTG